MARPRKPGERFPGGKLKPAAKPTADPISGAEWQRIRQHGRRIGADHRLATELSRLNLFGELTIVQTTAGHRVGEIYGAYEGLKGLHRSVRSPSYERAYGASRDSWARDDAEEAAAKTFGEFQEVVIKLGARHLFAPLEELCVEDRHISPVILPSVRDLLEELAGRWRMSTVRRAHAGSARGAGKGAAAPAAPPRLAPNLDRQSMLRVLKALRPDLPEEQLQEAYDLGQALKQREIFRRSKQDPSSNVIRLPSLKKETADV